MDAVTALNTALENASCEGIFVELGKDYSVGGRNPKYYVEKIETRETVLP